MKKCAIVGVGGRHKMFREALVKNILSIINWWLYVILILADCATEQSLKKSNVSVACYLEKDFDKLLRSKNQIF